MNVPIVGGFLSWTQCSRDRLHIHQDHNLKKAVILTHDYYSVKFLASSLLVFYVTIYKASFADTVAVTGFIKIHISYAKHKVSFGPGQIFDNP